MLLPLHGHTVCWFPATIFVAGIPANELDCSVVRLEFPIAEFRFSIFNWWAEQGIDPALYFREAHSVRQCVGVKEGLGPRRLVRLDAVPSCRYKGSAH